MQFQKLSEILLWTQEQIAQGHFRLASHRTKTQTSVVHGGNKVYRYIFVVCIEQVVVPWKRIYIQCFKNYRIYMDLSRKKYSNNSHQKVNAHWSPPENSYSQIVIKDND